MRFENLPVLGTSHRFVERNSGIDLMRGFLALWVVFAHLLPWAILSGQSDAILMNLNSFWRMAAVSLQSFGALNPAVLGFVVLSGYCIHRNGLRTGQLALKPYIFKRFFRIIPLFLLAAVVGYFLILFLGSDPLIFQLTGRQEADIFSLFTKISGLGVFFPFAYPAIFQGNAPLNTVMVEIWLYVFYPIGLAIAHRFGMTKFAVIVVLVFLFGLGIAQVYGQPNWFQSSSIYKFSLYWWIGAMFVSAKNNRFFVRTILICFAIYSVAYSQGWKSVVFVEILQIGMALLFGYLIRKTENLNWTNKVPRPIIYLGQSSYSLYAFHGPIVILCLYFMLPWWLTLIAVMILSAILFTFLERPSTRLGYKFAAKYSS